MTETNKSNRMLGLRAELSEKRLDAFVVSSLPNVRYLSGFTGSNAALLVSPSETVLFTDSRYRLQAAQETQCAVRVASGPLLLAVMTAVRRKRLRRIGFEKSHLSYLAYTRIKEALPSGASLVAVDGLVESLRLVKSEEEISLIRRAVSTNSKAFSKAIKKIRPGLRETELAAEIDYQMRKLGAEKPAFETIVAAGCRTALPHARPTGNALSNNQLLLIDMGATQDGYASDMTRMSFLGRPGREVKRIYSAVLEAQLAAIASVREGVTAAHVDRQARSCLRKEKLASAFLHSTGHGLGLEIHEAPLIGRREKTRLQAGMVITIEPGAYLDGVGGVRIEDVILVTRNGCEVLTPTSKELLLF